MHVYHTIIAINLIYDDVFIFQLFPYLVTNWVIGAGTNGEGMCMSVSTMFKNITFISNETMRIKNN